MKKYLLEIIVFVGGANVMILEMAGSRILAPYLGTSIYVWTSLIGTILLTLSLGYFKGGKLADNNPSPKSLALILLICAGFIAAVSLFKENILYFLQSNIKDLRIASMLAALVLFGAPSMLLGMVLPFACKLKIKNLSESGTTVGRLYALSTIGSIAGTFLAGFFLISFLGSNLILIFIAVCLFLTSLYTYSDNLAGRVALITILLGAVALNLTGNQSGVLADADTDYSRVRIIDSVDSNNRPIRIMRINNELSSAMYLDGNDLVFDYAKFYRLDQHFKPDLKYTLLIGGGGYSYPKDFLNRFRKSYMDVVEIDPKITWLAREYFYLPETDKLVIFHEDGRPFLNRNAKKYDVIYIDAYRSVVIPYQLTTREAVQEIYQSLTPTGLVLANLISSIEGWDGRFLRAEVATYKTVFPRVLIFPVQYPADGQKIQNIMLAAFKSPEEPALESQDQEIEGYLKNRWVEEIEEDGPILTDDYAPVDYYQSGDLR